MRFRPVSGLLQDLFCVSILHLYWTGHLAAHAIRVEAHFDAKKELKPSKRQLGFEWFPEEKKTPLYTDPGDQRQVYIWLQTIYPGTKTHVVVPDFNETLREMTTAGLHSFDDDQHCTTKYQVPTKHTPPYWYSYSKIIFCLKGYTVRLYNLHNRETWLEENPGKSPRNIRIKCTAAMAIAWDLARAIDVDARKWTVVEGTNVDWNPHFVSEQQFRWDQTWTGTLENPDSASIGVSYWMADPDWGILLGSQEGGKCPPQASSDWAEITDH